MADKNLVDLSPFLLFEATGDSDDIYISSDGIHLAKVGATSAAENDASDAMSCSYDDSSSDSSSSSMMINAAADGSDRQGSIFIGYDNDCSKRREYGSNEDSEDEGVVNQSWKGDKKMAELPHKSNNSSNVECVDPTIIKLISQEEQDKLFWEACLAS